MSILSPIIFQKIIHTLIKNLLQTLSSSLGSFDNMGLIVEAKLAILIQNGQTGNNGEFDHFGIEIKIVVFLQITLNYETVCLVTSYYYWNANYLV
jgi:hypothetical protein